VLNQGINGNKVLNSLLGDSALLRFDKDVLGQAGVKYVIMQEGINDIGFGTLPPNPVTDPATDVSAAQVIAGYQQLIAQAHARGLKIFGGTLLPFKDSFYYTAAGEAKREAVNAWIRTSGAFDGVIDFDRVLRDPDSPSQLLPRYDSGDHGHPNDEGYAAMAKAVDLRLFSVPNGR